MPSPEAFLEWSVALLRAHTSGLPLKGDAQNFFWGAIAQFGAPSNGAPFVRLAAQRIMEDDERIGGPLDLKMYPNLSPRLHRIIQRQQ